MKNDFKKSVKVWLKRKGVDREWLGKQCGGVSKRTVDTWLAESGKIPSRTESLIKYLMEDPRDVCDESSHFLLLRFSKSEMDVINRYKEAYPERSIEVYCHDKALEFCLGMVRASYGLPGLGGVM